jgi:hypothetical protein
MRINGIMIDCSRLIEKLLLLFNPGYASLTA